MLELGPEKVIEARNGHPEIPFFSSKLMLGKKAIENVLLILKNCFNVSPS